jgi:large subunit ribosomal protein L3
MSALRTGLLGKKLGMTQVFTEQGDLRAVTAIHAGANVVVGKRTVEKDGYSAVRLGYAEKPLRRSNKPEIGVFAKNNLAPQRFVREVRLAPADLDKYEVGKTVPLDAIFKPNTYIDVIGTSKGKGYQGVMKRHHMPGFRSTHGTHEFFRHGGSVGCRLTPGRVHKGKRMSGHMGDVRKTVQNLTLLQILAEENVLLVGGAIPGGKNGFVVVKNATKRVGAIKVKGAGEQQEKSKNPMKASKAGAGAAKATKK